MQFGPSRTTLTPVVANRIHALVLTDNLVSGEYLFHGSDRRAACLPSAWTRLVQAAFKAASGVALCPKDCRSSFVTWARDNQAEHGSEVLASAAKALRHSSKTAASAAYDKHGTDRVVEAAVSATDTFAARFE